jgi:hypothetical protein
LPASFNARAETVPDKPVFRDAFRRNRCVIPASGYHEWLKRPDGRQPYFISPADGGVLSFAGLWDRWKNPESGQPVISCTIILTDANELTRPIHDRMPVVLDRANIRQWLANGQSRGGVGGWPHLDVPPAARAEIPRRRAGPGDGRGDSSHSSLAAPTMFCSAARTRDSERVSNSIESS